MALVHWPKELARTLRRLGAAQKQVTVLAQPIVERGEDHLLQVPLQVDQQVAADDQIEARKGRVVQQVVGGEEHPCAHLGLHLVVAVGEAEEARQPLRRDGDGNGGRVDARTAKLQRRIAQVRGKDLDLGRIVQGIGILQQQDGERVRFLAGGTARRPHAHLVAAAFPGKEARNDGVGQGGPRLGVAEEFGDVNEQVVKERLGLGRILAQRRPNRRPAWRRG